MERDIAALLKAYDAPLSDATLRDILAGFALIADHERGLRTRQADKEAAAHAYSMADAMLEIRQHDDPYEGIG